MSNWTNLDTSNVNQQSDISIDNGLSQAFLQGYTLGWDRFTFRHNLKLSYEDVDATIQDIKELEYSVHLIMQGQAYAVRPEMEGGPIYNVIPVTQEELKQLFGDLVARDLQLKARQTYAQEVLDQLRGLTDAVADLVIAFADGTGTCTWDKFITYFE